MNQLIRQMMMFASRKFKVGSITVTGTGQYSGTPTVQFSGGGGTGAQATANMTLTSQAGVITDFWPGFTFGYGLISISAYSMTSDFPTITISGGGGAGGAVSFTQWSPGRVYGGTGVCEVSASSVSFTISGGGGSNASFGNQTGLVPRRCTVSNINVTNGGSGYTVAPTVVFTLKSGGGNSFTQVIAPTATANISGGQVVSITITEQGEYIRTNTSSGGTAGYDISFSGGNGNGAFASQTGVGALSWWGGPEAWNGFDSYIGINILNTGDNYTSAPSLTVSNYVGNGTLGTIIGRVPVAWTITNEGSGYTSNPSVSISGGTAATFLPTYSSPYVTGTWGSYYYVNTITVTNSGTGYDTAPTISFSGGGQSVAATATANMISE